MVDLNNLVPMFQDFDCSDTEILDIEKCISLTIVPDKKEELLFKSNPDDDDFKSADEFSAQESYLQKIAATKCDLEVEKVIECDEDHKKED